MKFNFHIIQCANNNSDEARIREATRMAMICWCLRAQGHEAFIASVAPVFQMSNRWPQFSDLYRPGFSDGLSVHPAESLRRGLQKCEIAFKCSVGTQHDSMYLNRCQLLVAHEYDDNLHEHHRLLKTTFGVHHNIFDHLVEQGLYQDFLENRLDAIRAFYRDGVTPHEKPVGFYGQKWPHRQALLETAPDWVEWGLYDHTPAHPAMPTLEHTRWMCGFRACLAIRGDSPKTNLPPLLAMLGLPIIYEPITRDDVPEFGLANTIPLVSWEHVAKAVWNQPLLDAVAKNATDDYINGWSPAGQARLIAERFA
jgi:hypothetical protein